MKTKVAHGHSILIAVLLLTPFATWAGNQSLNGVPQARGQAREFGLAQHMKERLGPYRHRFRQRTALERASATADGPDFNRNVDLVGRWAEGPTYDLAARGDTLFLACGGYLKIIDFSDPSQPVEVGKQLTPSVARAVTLGAEHAYVVDSVDGLGVFDITDPKRPLEVGRRDYNDRNMRVSGFSVAAEGNYVYVNDAAVSNRSRRNALRILDVSNPSHPEEIGNINVGFGDMDFSNGFVYVASRDVSIIDVSNPAQCKLVGCYTETGFSEAAVAIVDNHAIVVGVGMYRDASGWKYKNGIVLDVSNPATPRKVGEIRIPANDVAVRGKYAFLASDWGRVYILDVSDPASPVEVSQLDVDGSTKQIVVTDRFAFVTTGGWWDPPRVLAIDISDPAKPVLVGEHVANGGLSDVAKEGNLLYTTDHLTGLRILDVSKPSEPVEVGRYADGKHIWSVAVQEGIAYLGMDPGLRMLDVSDPARPIELGSIEGCSDYDCWGVSKILLSESYAYLAVYDWSYSSHLMVLDISSPANPTEAGRLRLDVDIIGGMALDGGIIFVAGINDIGDRGGLRVVSVADPTHPIEIGRYETGGWAEDVTISGHLAYLAGDGIRVLDVTDPTSPTELGRCHTPGFSYSVECFGSYVHVADGRGGYRVIDASDPRNPTEIAYFNRGNDATELLIDSSHAFVGDANGGLYILSFVPTVAVDVDIEPNECPNTIELHAANPKSWEKGEDGKDRFLTVAVYGTRTFRVEDVDVFSLRLEGVEPANNHQIKDVGKGRQGPGEENGCVERMRDGHVDLLVRFRRSDVVSRLGEVYDNLERALLLTGKLIDGRQLEGFDHVKIVFASQDDHARIKWARRFGDTEYQWLSSVAVDSAGNVFATGTFRGTVNFGGEDLVNVGPEDAFLMKLAHNGRHLWSRSFCDTRAGDPRGEAVAVDASGNVFLAGEFWGSVCLGGDTLRGPPANPRVFLAKFESGGDHLWSRKIGWLGSQFVRGMSADPAGGVILVGTSYARGTPSGPPSACLTKFDADGRQVWHQTFPGDGVYVKAVAVDAFGDILVAGSFGGSVDLGDRRLTSVMPYNSFLVKLDSDGRHVWSHGFGDSNYQEVHSVAVDPEGDVVIAGDFMGQIDFGGGQLKSNGDRDAFIAKFNRDSRFIWNKSFGDIESQSISSITADAVGNIYATGGFAGTMDWGLRRLHSLGGSDIFVATFDPDGSNTWCDSYGDSEGSQGGGCIAVDRLERVVVGGRFDGSVDFGFGPLVSEGADIFLAKLDPAIAPHGHRVSGLTGESVNHPLQLGQNVPNPFNPSTTIPVDIPEKVMVTLSVYNVKGELTRTLLNEVAGSGRREVIWDGKDSQGNSVSSGVYFYRLIAGTKTLTRKAVLVR